MKKLFALLLCLCMLTSTVAYADVSSGVTDKEYELWTQSPSITCGLTSDDIRIYKALDQNILELLPLSIIITFVPFLEPYVSFIYNLFKGSIINNFSTKVSILSLYKYFKLS